MITYSKQELIPANEIAGNIGKFLNSIKNRCPDKIAIMRNNIPEAVLMPIDEYERLYEACELLEYLDIYKTVKDREQTPVEEYITHEEMIQRLEADEE